MHDDGSVLDPGLNAVLSVCFALNCVPSRNGIDSLMLGSSGTPRSDSSPAKLGPEPALSASDDAVNTAARCSSYLAGGACGRIESDTIGGRDTSAATVTIA